MSPAPDAHYTHHPHIRPVMTRSIIHFHSKIGLDSLDWIAREG